MPNDWLSPAQCFGYLAFVLGVASFLQTNDRRFKQLMIGECLAYVAHFALLGNPTAVASSVVSVVRSAMACKVKKRVGIVLMLNFSNGLNSNKRLNTIFRPPLSLIS